MMAATDLRKTVQPQISLEDFLKFREYFYRRTGIFFEDSKRYFVDKRLLERMQRSGADCFRDYFMQLRIDLSGEEMQQLVNLMTVNETYFLREEYQFRCMVRSILPDIISRRQPGERIRIWSMPSSTGEEPYSIAIYLLEYWPDIEHYEVELVASDIDTAVLRQARQGVFSRRSLQYLPIDLLARYFTPCGNDYRLNAELRESVQFTRVNLHEPADTRDYRDFDLIFCRNLLIYFDDLSRRQAAETFFDALNPGGYICLGHSESMSRISSLFQVRKFPEAIVYQKPIEG
ncbi:CheR family methyltransferase [Chitinimonas lacunae]|uniref:Chemotaxis protein methyltransferase n=1 Tax=Chitinimonas lacunae TaxID=1963018 RepID=A0ABV8MLG4_9NEIS